MSKLNFEYKEYQEVLYSEQVVYDNHKRLLLCIEEEMYYLLSKIEFVFNSIEVYRTATEPAFISSRNEVLSISLIPHLVSEFRNILMACLRVPHITIMLLCKSMCLILGLCNPYPQLEDCDYLKLVISFISSSFLEQIYDFDPTTTNPEAFDLFEQTCMHHSSFKKNTMAIVFLIYILKTYI